MRTRCSVSGCRNWQAPGKYRCHEHQAQQNAMQMVNRNARRKAMLATGTNAQARMRKAVDKAGGARCAECRQIFPASFIDIDHRTPLHTGGLDIEENVRPMCKTDHAAKTKREQQERHRKSPR